MFPCLSSFLCPKIDKYMIWGMLLPFLRGNIKEADEVIQIFYTARVHFNAVHSQSIHKRKWQLNIPGGRSFQFLVFVSCVADD